MGGMDGHTQYNIRLFFVRYLSVQNDFFNKKTRNSVGCFPVLLLLYSIAPFVSVRHYLLFISYYVMFTTIFAFKRRSFYHYDRRFNGKRGILPT